MMDRSYPLRRFKLFERGPQRTRTKEGMLISLSLCAFGDKPDDPIASPKFMSWVCVLAAHDGSYKLQNSISPLDRDDVSANQRALAHIWYEVRMQEIERAL